MAIIVDDKQFFLRQFANKHARVFARMGLGVALANTAAGAMKTLRDLPDARDAKLAIVDIVLKRPRESMRLMDRIRSQYPWMKIVAITGQAERDAVGKMAAHRLIDGYIDKDWGEDKARREIRRVSAEPSPETQEAVVVQALEHLLEKNPEARQRRYSFSGRPGMTFEDLLREIRQRSEFGRKQERLLFQMVIDFLSTGELESEKKVRKRK
jgi:DNA-binding NtrC family response regulator